MKIGDFIYEVFITAQAKPICGIPSIRRLTPTSANIRIPLTGDLFVDAFHNEFSGRTAFALLKNKTGLKVYAVLDGHKYALRKRVSPQEMKTLQIIPHKFHGEWNYTIKPRK